MGLSKFQSANFWRGKNGEHDEEPLDFGYLIHASTRGTGSFFRNLPWELRRKFQSATSTEWSIFSFQYLGETTGILIGEVCPKVAWFTKPKKVSWNGHKLGYTPYSWTNLSDPIRVSPSVLPKHRSVQRFKDQSIVLWNSDTWYFQMIESCWFSSQSFQQFSYGIINI